MLAHMPGWEATGVDLPGHGAAPDWDGVTDYGDAAHALADMALGVGTDVLVGHSFGAVVALRLALSRPGAVGRLVLIEPVLFAAARGTLAYAANAAAFAPYVAAMEAGDSLAATRAFTGIWGDGRAVDALPQLARDALVSRIHLIAAGAPTLHEDRAGLLAPGRLEGLGCPVTLIEGGDSPAVIGAIHAHLAARLPRVARVVIPGAGHMVPLTHPAQVAATVQG
jgi:lipase